LAVDDLGRFRWPTEVVKTPPFAHFRRIGNVSGTDDRLLGSVCPGAQKSVRAINRPHGRAVVTRDRVPFRFVGSR
jgi:hypothetical protein